MFRVYGLHDGSGVVRYVGSTSTSLRLRRDWHVGVAHRGGSAPVAKWIRDLESNGSRPGIARIAIARSAEEAASVEAAWIRFFTERSHALLNVRSRTYVPTIAHRIAISRAMRGRQPSLTTRWRMAAAARRAAVRRRREMQFSMGATA
jgi:hypothetical protein